MDNKQSKKFILWFALSSIIFLLCIGGVMYIIDPFFQYRTRDKQYLLNPLYVNPGIAKNYDYNTVIIGSSMVQNYNLEILKRDTLVKPVKLASGAIAIQDMKLLYSLLQKDKVDTYILNLDMIQFNEWMPPRRYPEYLYKEGFLNKLRYHYAYESVVRYGLIDILMVPYLASKTEEELPKKLKLRYSIENIGNFSLDATYNDEERIKGMYLRGDAVSPAMTSHMGNRMTKNIDLFLEFLEIDKNKDKEYIFVLPPYSALYWCITQEGKNYYKFLTAKIMYLCRETKKYENVRIQYFYNLEQITDLNRYSDVTHFDPATSQYMLENLRNDNFTITTSNMHSFLNELDSTITKFKMDNAEWIKKQ